MTLLEQHKNQFQIPGKVICFHAGTKQGLLKEGSIYKPFTRLYVKGKDCYGFMTSSRNFTAPASWFLPLQD